MATSSNHSGIAAELLQHGYTFNKPLGSGAQGTVFLCEIGDGKAKEQVAVKLLHKDMLKNKYVRNEVLNHSRLMHHNIVEFKEVFMLKNHLCIAMEYCDQGTLFDKVRRGLATEDQARGYMQHLIYALDYCHRKGVVNRDVKLENVLLKTEVPEGSTQPMTMVKLCDFGYSKCSEASAAKSLVGTVSYMAPEVVATCDQSTGIPYDGCAVDVWSCGVMLYILLHGKYPFYTPAGHRRPSNEELKQIRDSMTDRSALYKQLRADLSEECKGLLSRMLEPDPRHRIKVQEVMVHPWYGIKPEMLPDFLQCNDTLLSCTEEDYDRKQTPEQVRAIVEEAGDRARISRDC